MGDKPKMDDYLEYSTPYVIFEEKQIVHVACGMNHMACVDRRGTLFTQGAGDFGQLGMGDNKKRTVFCPVLALKD